MKIDEIMIEVSETLKTHDSGIGVELTEQDDRGLAMRIKIYHIDKFLGFIKIAEIINKVLNKHGTQLVSLTLSKKKNDKGIKKT